MSRPTKIMALKDANGKTFDIVFYAGTAGAPDCVIIDFGDAERRLLTTDFVRDFSAVMLEAFEWVGGPFGMVTPK